MIIDEFEAVVSKIRFYPECIPFCAVVDLSVGNNPIYTLTRLPTVAATGLPTALIIDGVSLLRKNEVTTRQTLDSRTHEKKAGAGSNLGVIDPWFEYAISNTSLVLHTTAAISAYQFYQPIWIIDPSIAWKIKYGVRLSEAERKLADEKNVYSSVKKGLLPFPLHYQKDREYIGYSRSYGQIVASALANRTTPIGLTIRPEPNQVAVLESITAERSADAAWRVQIYVSRDEDKQFLKLPTYAMDLTYDVPCWIVALKELNLELYTEHDLTNYRVRYRIGVYNLSDILKVRFLPAERERMPDLWTTVRSGVLP